MQYQGSRSERANYCNSHTESVASCPGTSDFVKDAVSHVSSRISSFCSLPHPNCLLQHCSMDFFFLF